MPCNALPLRLCLLLALLLSAVGCMPDARQMPTARQGVLDLSAWDLKRDGPVRLDGQWAVRWGGVDSPTQEYAELPGPWTRTMPGAGLLRATGEATLRLKVLRGPDMADAALRLGYISAAWTLWADGRMIARSGVAGPSAALEQPQYSAQVVPLHAWSKPEGEPLELVLYVSNHHYREGGVLEPLLLGAEAELLMRERRQAGMAMFLAGTLFVMGMYHVAMYRFRRADPAPLLFGLYCLLWLGCYTCTDSSAWVANLLFPGLPGVGLERFGVACFYLSIPLGFAFFRSLYPCEFSRRVFVYTLVTGLLATGLALAGPSQWFSTALPLYYVSSIGLIVYCWVGLWRAWRLRREGAAFIFAGFLALGLVGVNDMLTDMRLISSTPVLPLGMLLFVLGQALALSLRLQRAFCSVKSLSTQLESKNLSLEAEMEERGRLEREIINISEEERRRMSVDLHDGLCQLLTAARLRCAVLGGMPRSEAEKAELGKLSALLDELVDHAYDLSHGLWPLEHDAQGAGPSLADMIRRFSRSSGVPIAFTQERGCECCHGGHTTQLFRIAQEALSNAVKHAEPSRIEVHFHCAPGGLASLTVRDNGIGRAAAKRSKGGLGMGIMAHRARMIGGVLRVENAEGGGTVVRCSSPCDLNKHQSQRRRP